MYQLLRDEVLGLVVAGQLDIEVCEVLALPQ